MDGGVGLPAFCLPPRATRTLANPNAEPDLSRATDARTNSRDKRLARYTAALNFCLITAPPAAFARAVKPCVHARSTCRRLRFCGQTHRSTFAGEAQKNPRVRSSAKRSLLPVHGRAHGTAGRRSREQLHINASGLRTEPL
jgi:hypothetical protein